MLPPLEPAHALPATLQALEQLQAIYGDVAINLHIDWRERVQRLFERRSHEDPRDIYLYLTRKAYRRIYEWHKEQLWEHLDHLSKERIPESLIKPNIFQDSVREAERLMEQHKYTDAISRLQAAESLWTRLLKSAAYQEYLNPTFRLELVTSDEATPKRHSPVSHLRKSA